MAVKLAGYRITLTTYDDGRTRLDVSGSIGTRRPHFSDEYSEDTPIYQILVDASKIVLDLADGKPEDEIFLDDGLVSEVAEEPKLPM